MRGVKLYIDGALGSRGAALLADYSDEPGNRGLLVTDPATYEGIVRKAKGCGVQVATHAIGDRGNRIVIDRSEEHTSELQSLMRISYAVFCLKKKKTTHRLPLQ